MARLAEMSVAIALRDWQWLHRMARDQFPDRYLGLAGNAESKLGDALIRHDERLFMFELKSSEATIKDEWIPTTLKSGKKRPKKSAHRWARRLAGRILKSGSKSASSDRALLLQSLQAHHFVYWTSMLARSLPASGHLNFEPYALATMRRCNHLTWSTMKRRWQGAAELAAVHPSLAGDAAGSIRYRMETVLPLDVIDGRKARLMTLIDRVSGVRDWRYLGLPLNEFQSYVNDLCGGLKKAEEINVVVLSDQGSFFAHLTSTTQLKSIFDPPDPDKRVQHEAHAALDDTQMPIAYPAEEVGFHPGLL